MLFVNMPSVPSEVWGQIFIGAMIALGYFFNYFRGRLQLHNQALNGRKMDRIELALNGPTTLLIRQLALVTRRLANMTQDPLDIAAAEAAEAAVVAREEAKA